MRGGLMGGWIEGVGLMLMESSKTWKLGKWM